MYLKNATNARFFDSDEPPPSDDTYDTPQIVALVAVAIDKGLDGFSADDGPPYQAHRRLAAGAHTTVAPTVIDARPRPWA